MNEYAERLEEIRIREGESLAILAGIKVNSAYLYGIQFEVVTDHEPLVPLYNNPSRPAPVRVERHRSKLRSFVFTTTCQAELYPVTTPQDIHHHRGTTQS